MQLLNQLHKLNHLTPDEISIELPDEIPNQIGTPLIKSPYPNYSQGEGGVNKMNSPNKVVDLESVNL